MSRMRFALAAIVAIPFAFCPNSYGEEEFQAGKLRAYGTFDIFAPTNAGDSLWNDVQSGMGQLSGMGYSSTGSINTRAALGGRLGLMVQVTEEFDIGISGGYIAGPNSNASVSFVGGGYSGVLSDKRDVSFARFLLEPTLNVKIDKSSAFHFGAGLGVAQGRIKETITCSGSACSVNGNVATNYQTWNGFTWEFSPYFSFSDFLIVVRYAGFPTFKGDTISSKIEWNSWGAFIGFKI